MLDKLRPPDASQKKPDQKEKDIDARSSAAHSHENIPFVKTVKIAFAKGKLRDILNWM
jgi:hypothetical protein